MTTAVRRGALPRRRRARHLRQGTPAACDASSNFPCKSRNLPRCSLLVLLIMLFQIRSDGVFLSANNMRGILGLLPETALVAVGVTLLMICGEFDLSVGSVFALMPMTMAVLMVGRLAVLAGDAGWPCWLCAADRLSQRLDHHPLRHPVLHHHAGHAVHGAVADRGDLGRLSAPDQAGRRCPSWLFVGFVDAGGLIRASFLWFVGIAILISLLLVAGPTSATGSARPGGFLPAAAAMGIPTGKVKIACFMICSVLAGFAGMIQVAAAELAAALDRRGDGTAGGGAAVIGGTSLAGGIGSIIGGIIGATLIRVIDNGMVMSPGRRQLVQVRDRRADHLRRRRQCLAAPPRSRDESGDRQMTHRRSSKRRNLHKWYSGRPCAEGRQPDGRAGRGAWARRRQRRRQVDADQDPVGPAPAGRGRDPGRGQSGPTSAIRKDAMHLGIETIYQYNSMVPIMTIARNMFIGREPLKWSIGGIGILDEKQDARGKRQGDRRCRPASALAGCAGGRVVRRPAAGRGDRAGHAFQVQGDDPGRADEPSVGQGNHQGDRLREGPEGAGRHRASSSATTCTTSSPAATGSSPWRSARSCWTSRSRETSIEEVSEQL